MRHIAVIASLRSLRFAASSLDSERVRNGAPGLRYEYLEEKAVLSYMPSIADCCLAFLPAPPEQLHLVPECFSLCVCLGHVLLYCDPLTPVSSEARSSEHVLTSKLGNGRLRCFPPRILRACAASRPTTDGHACAERERESLTKARQTLGWQEATVPEVAATAEAQSVGLS